MFASPPPTKPNTPWLDLIAASHHAPADLGSRIRRLAELAAAQHLSANAEHHANPQNQHNPLSPLPGRHGRPPHALVIPAHELPAGTAAKECG